MKQVSGWKRRLGSWLVIVGSIILVALGTVIAVYVVSPRVSSPEQSSKIEQPIPQPVSISANTLFFGNVFWGRYINDWSMASPLKTAYPFSRLHEFDRGSYDAWIAGLECPTVANFSQTSAQEDTTLSFNCSPDYLSEASQWFTAFTLANNHTDNRGAEGFEETKQQLEKHGIQYFGHYDPNQTADVCEVVALPMTVTYDDGSTQRRSMPVAMCGYHGVFKIPSQESMAVMEAYSEVMPVIALPHMGVEYKPAPDEIKTTTYRSLIDHGADVVIGDHPHWIQTTEVYKGHLIVYSMGNFIFDQQDTSEVVRSAGIRVVMSVKDSNATDITKWLALAETCKRFQDDCLSNIQAQQLGKLPYTYQFGVVGTNDADKIVKPATPEQQASILQRLNWANSMSQLQSPYASL